MFLTAQIKIKEDFIMEKNLNLPGWKIGPLSETVYHTNEMEVAVITGVAPIKPDTVIELNKT